MSSHETPEMGRSYAPSRDGTFLRTEPRWDVLRRRAQMGRPYAPSRDGTFIRSEPTNGRYIPGFLLILSLRTLIFTAVATNFRGQQVWIRENSLPLPSFAVSLAPVASIDAGNAGSARDAREVVPLIQHGGHVEIAVCISSRSPLCIKATAPQAQRIPASRDISQSL